MKLAGQVVVVTGGAAGLGYAFAQRFLREGATVAIADISRAADTAGTLGERCFGVAVDVASEASVAAMVEEVLARAGQVDVLVNNAAISSELKLRPFEMTTAEEWLHILGVNTIGTYLCCKAVVPHMRARGGGCIINLASGTAFKGTPLLLPYIASKGAIISMTRGLAQELGKDGIRVNAIAPGYTVTAGMKGNTEFYNASRDVAIATRALKRDATPDDIVGTAVFLASDDANFITGQILAVDGGSVYH